MASVRRRSDRMSEQDITRGDVWWVTLDPTQGSGIKKTRPCVMLTHNTLNKLRKTVVVPLSSAARPHHRSPFRSSFKTARL